jgi:hypothetical protein
MIQHETGGTDETITSAVGATSPPGSRAPE